MKICAMTSLSFRMTALAATATLLSLAPASRAADPLRIVFKGGRSLPVDAITVENGQFKVLTAQDSFTAGQTFKTDLADYISGEKPEAINRGVAFILMDKPVEAIAQLEPVLNSQKVTASVQGNYWVEAARALLVAYARIGNNTKMEALGKELADATPESGTDPGMLLAKAISLPLSTKLDDRLNAFGDLLEDKNPVDVSAYAAFFRANFLSRTKKEAEALQGYLTVPCLYPTGGSVINGAAELFASESLVKQSRREEAVALLRAAMNDARGTVIADEAKKRLESLK
jgi:tetratricopeptide (TPR) repeat protein